MRLTARRCLLIILLPRGLSRYAYGGGSFTDPKGTVRSRPCLKMAAGSNTDHLSGRVDLFPASGKGRKSKDETGARNEPGLRLSKRIPADDTSLGVSNVGHAQQ
jgi:hypothetical protein